MKPFTFHYMRNLTGVITENDQLIVVSHCRSAVAKSVSSSSDINSGDNSSELGQLSTVNRLQAPRGERVPAMYSRDQMHLRYRQQALSRLAKFPKATRALRTVRARLAGSTRRMGTSLCQVCPDKGVFQKCACQIRQNAKTSVRVLMLF